MARHQTNDAFIGNRRSVVDSRGSKRSVRGKRGVTNSDMYFQENEDLRVDQSGSHHSLRGAPNASTYMNHIKGGRRIRLKQNNVNQHAVASGKNATTALLCVKNCSDFQQQFHNSIQIVEGTAGQNSVVAGTIVRGSKVTIVQSNSTSIVSVKRPHLR